MSSVYLNRHANGLGERRYLVGPDGPAPEGLLCLSRHLPAEMAERLAERLERRRQDAAKSGTGGAA